MSGRGVVMLHKIRRRCPSCKAPCTVRTGSLGTLVHYTCDPHTCRLARIVALAGRWQDRTEPLPTDDRRAPRRFRGVA